MVTVGVSPNSSPAAGLILAASPDLGRACPSVPGVRAALPVPCPSSWPSAHLARTWPSGAQGFEISSCPQLFGRFEEKFDVDPLETKSFPLLRGLRGSGASSESESGRVPRPRSEGWSRLPKDGGQPIPSARGTHTIRRGCPKEERGGRGLRPKETGVTETIEHGGNGKMGCRWRQAGRAGSPRVLPGLC